MSSVLAILAVTGLYAALLAPLLLAVWKSAAALPVAGGYSVLLALTTGYHSGMFTRTILPGDLSTAVAQVVPNAQCAEVLSLLDRAGAIMERNRPPRLVVAAAAWSQLPEEGQRVIVDCVERSWPSGTGPAQLDVRP